MYLLTDHSIETREENLPDVRSSIQEVRNEVTFKPSGFLENKGQWEDASIRFLLEKPGLSVILGEDYIFYKLDYFNATSEGNNYFNHHVKVLLEGANRQSKVVVEGKSQDDRNYFLGGAPTTDVHHYQKVVYEDVYPGIDLVFEAYDPENEKFGFKYSFIVHPHANPDLIQLKYDGQEDLTTQEKHLVEASESGITEINRLAIHTSGGIFGEELSQVYTLKGGIRTAVDAAFKVVDKHNVRIKLDEYSKKETLVIDPEVVSVVLRRATYYGSEGTDRMNKVDLVDSGIKKNIVVIGTTSGTLVNLSTPGAFDIDINGNNDMIIAKFSPDLGQLLTATYYGGDGEEDGLAISYIDDGNIIIGGYTSSTNLPLDNSDNDNNYESLGGEDMVVASFDSTLSTLNWVFTLGGAENERVNDLIFYNDQIFAVGTAASDGLETVGSPFSGGNSDAIVASINAQKGTSDWIITSNWISYYGNDRADEGNGITAFDNKVYITGQITEGTRDNKSFVAEFEANNGNIRATKSYTDFGSKSNDIAINSDGSLLALSGVIEANHDGLTGISNGAQTTYGGGDSDGILLVVNTNDLSINWSSYLGGENDDNLLAVTFDCNNNVLAAGNSRSTSNISTDLLYNSYNGGGNGENDTGDAIMVKFSESGEQLWWYYFGDKADERAFDLSLGENGEILLVGETSSQDGITTKDPIDPVYDEIYGDNEDGGNVGFISTFCDLIIDKVPRGLTVPLGGEASFSIGTNFCGMIGYTWTKDGVPISANVDVGFGLVSGSDTAELDIESVTLASEGEYCVTILTTCGEETLCAPLDIVSLGGTTGVCLDQESSLNLPGVNQQTIELTFPNLEENDFISDAVYEWSVTAVSGDLDGADDVIAGSVGNFPATLPLSEPGLHNIFIMPTASGTYTYRLDLTYNDSRRNPPEVENSIEKTITVNPFPTLNSINVSSNEICENERALVSLETDIDVLNIEYTRIDGNTDLTGNESGDIDNINGSSFDFDFNPFSNPTNQSIEAEYEIIPTTNSGCSGPADALIITVFPNPELEIQVDQDAICSGENVSVAFSALSSPDYQSNGGTEITWTRLANPGISNEPGNPVTVSNSGTIDETLTNNTNQVQTVTYQLEGLFNGCETTQTISIAVLPEAQLNFNTGEVTGCSGDNFMLELVGITTLDMPAQLEVIFQDNPNIEGDVGGTFSLDANSTVDVAYILTNPTNTVQSVMATITPYFVVEDAVECRGKSEDFEFIVSPIPSLIDDSFNVCENVDFSFDLNALSNGVSGTSFDWSIFSSTDNVDGALSGSGSTISQKLSLNDGIEGEVVYEVSASAAGCEANPSFITITVLGEPEISFSTDPVTAEICDTDASPVTITTSFTGTSLDNINSIQWFQGDKILTGETNQKLQVSEAGFYKIEVESKGGCVLEDSIEIVEVKRASVSITAPAMSETCVNSDFTLETEITAGVADSYQWLLNGVEIAGATSETLVVNSEGNYQVVVNGSGTCPDTSSVVNLSFFPQPIPTYEVADAVCPNSVLNLSGGNDNSNAIIAQVEWSVTGDEPLPVFSSPNTLTTDLEFGENQSGVDQVYQVMLKLTTDDGCVDSFIQSVTHNSRPLVAFNFDSQNCPDTISLGTRETLNATSYSWEILTNQDSVAISDPTSANPKFIVSNAGNQTLEIEVKLTATNDANCEDASIQVLTVSPKPQLEIGKDATSGCPGHIINLNSNGSDPGEGLSFSEIAWTANGQTIGDTRKISFELVNAEVTNLDYQIILRGENTAGCSSQDTTVVTAHPNARSEIDLASTASTSDCAPFTINETIISLVDHQEANTEDYLWEVVDSEGMVIVSSEGVTPPTYEITTPGTQITYRLTANSSNGCAEDETTIVFNSFSEIKADFSFPEETICEGETVTFTNSSTNAVVFSWDFGDGSTSSVASPSHVFENTSFTEDATYRVELIATSSGGCRDTTLAREITIHPLPQVEFSVSDACGGDELTVTNNSSGQGNLMYVWATDNEDLATISNATAANPTIILSDNQSMDLDVTTTLTVTTENGCSETVERSFSSISRPVVEIGADNIQCINEAIFQNLSTSNSSVAPLDRFTWRFGDGTEETTNSLEAVSHIYADTGTYVVSLKALNTLDCEDSSSFTIRIIDLAEPSIASVFSPESGCGPQLTVDFDGDESIDYGVESYFWDFGNGQTSTDLTPGPITFLQSERDDITYAVSLTIDNICGTTSEEFDVTVRPSPTADFATTFTFGCDDVPVEFVHQSIGNPEMYIVDYNDGVIDTLDNREPFEHTFQNNSKNDATYNVLLIAVNECGRDTTDLDVTIVPFNDNPTISLGVPDGILCENEVFKARVSGLGFTVSRLFSWYLLDQSDSSTVQLPSNADSLQYSLPDTGSYSLISRVEILPCNGVVYDTLPLKVISSLPIDFFASAEACSDDKVSIENTGIYVSQQTEWDFGNGDTFTGIDPPDVSYSQEGSYTITMSLEANECISEVQKSIEIRASPVAMFSTDTVFCEGDVVIIKNQSSEADQYKWEVLETSDSIFTIDFRYIFPSDGSFSLSLTATSFFDGLECSTTQPSAVVVRPLPEISFEIIESRVCEDSTITLINNSTGATEFNWSFIDSENNSIKTLTSGDSLVNTSLPQGDDYTVRLEGISQLKCSNTSEMPLEVVTTISDLVITLTETPICGGVLISPLNNTTNPSRDDGKFKWYIDDQFVSDAYQIPEALTQIQREVGRSKEVNFRLKVENDVCSGEWEETFDVPGFFGCEFAMPTAFSPDNNGLNDVFKVRFNPLDLDNITEVNLKVFTLSEHLVHDLSMKRNDINSSMECIKGCVDVIDPDRWQESAFWDGTYNGEKKRDTYYYTVDVKCCNADPQAKSGYVQLVTQ